MSRQVTDCPVCDAPLQITELSCARCETKLHGVFAPAPLARLSPEHQRALGVSYPTVRNRLDAAVGALEAVLTEEQAPQTRATVGETNPRDLQRRAVLHQVQQGAIDPAEAAELLRDL